MKTDKTDMETVNDQKSSPIKYASYLLVAI